MKKLIFCLFTAVLTAGICAGADKDALLSKIEKANSAITAIQGHFDHDRTLPSGKVVKMNGVLYFQDGKMSMVYSVPVGDKMVINGDKVFIKRSPSEPAVYDATKNPGIATLRNTLVCCMQGKVKAVAEANEAEVSVKEESRQYVVTLTATRKAARGYSKIVLVYRKADCLLTSMLMEEVTGIKNKYTVVDPLLNKKPEASVFDIPKR